MATLFRLASRSFWGSICVAVFSSAFGLFAIAGIFGGFDPNASANMVRYLFFGVFFLGIGGFAIRNALILRQKGKK